MKPIHDMSGMEKAATLLIALGADAASKVLKYLDEDSLRKISLEIARIDKLSVEEREEMIGEFMLEFKKKGGTIFGGKTVARDYLTSAFGEVKADDIFNKLTKKDLERGFDFINDIDSNILTSFLENEHFQTISVALAYFPASKSAEILNLLPPYTAKEVSKRMARLGRTSPEAVLEIIRFLKKKYNKYIESSNNYKVADGVNILIDILSLMNLDQEKKLLNYFDRSFPDIYDKIRERIFTFNHVLNLTHQEIQILIDELNDDYLIAKALKGAGDEIRFKFFRNMSRNRATDILSEMESMGSVRMSDIEDARGKIVSTMRILNDSGIITIRKEKVEYVE